MADDPYLRVYRHIVDDRRFERVYPDDRNLATWLRLSMDADAAWPASAPLPYGTTKATLALLEGVGLIVRQSGNRYRGPGPGRGAREAQAERQQCGGIPLE